MAQSRRDQIQAQSYVWSRLVSALVTGDADAAENPNRRLLTGTVGGLLLAALITIGVTAYGFVRPGGATAWEKPGVLIVEKETGSRYALVDGRLRPILNYASVRLFFGKDPQVIMASAKSLGAVPHGDPLGVVGAPDGLPVAGRVSGQAWTVCAAATSDLTGKAVPITTLSIAEAGPRTDRPLDTGSALLVAGDVMVWQGRRIRLTEDWLARVLGADGPPLPVQPTWLGALPAGPDLAPVPVPGRGDAGPSVDGRPTRIGELFSASAENGAQRRFVLQSDGLMTLSPMAYAVVAADPATAALYRGEAVATIPLSLAALAQLPVSGRAALSGSLPQEPPRLITRPPSGLDWCVRQNMGDGQIEVSADRTPGASDAVTDGLRITRTPRTAAYVAVAAGDGGMVVAGRFDQALGNSRYLVTDAGVKYPVPDAATAERLGYPSSGDHPVPPALLDLLPTGPLLSGDVQN
ncbi:type VII secretion protein EccB [Actinoplanes sp. NPDC051343]|uniref:type VII secretion protein EccB n=1 Tax=Actinoplanes sp. NPDC051343 TaxID=3363906 RepID=UPI0037A4317F